MKTSVILVTVFMVLLALPVATLEAQLVPHAAEYKVRISAASGELRTELRQTDDGYAARHVLKPKGLAKLFARGSVTEVAEFAINGDDVVPLSYQTDDTLDDDELHASLEPEACPDFFGDYDLALRGQARRGECFHGDLQISY